MTKRIARYALASAAVAAFALPATPAQAHHCINMGTTPVECTLESIAISCIRVGTFIYECPVAA